MAEIRDRETGLRWRLDAARRLLGPDPAARLRALLAPPPPPPQAAVEPQAIGSLDAPPAGAVLERGVLIVAGWALFPAAPTARVEIWLGEHSLGLAQLGIPRADVAAESDLPAAGIAGFSLACDLAAWPGPDGETELRAEAVDVGSEQLGLGSIAVTVAPAPTPVAATPPRDPGRRNKGRRVLVCTHQLCLGGASRYLLETLEALIELEAVDPVVVSPIGGPLRPMLEALDIPVHVSGPVPLDDPSAYEGRIEELLAWARPQGFEAAFVNTISPLVGVGAEVAGGLGIPALWAIHESFEPAVLWAGCVLEVRERVEAAMRRAELAVFEAEATAAIFEPYLPGRCLTRPYGLDLAPIDAVRAGFDRDTIRHQLGIPADADLVVCVGSIDPRKAQAVLAQAFELAADRHPKARLALAGAGDTVDTKALAGWIAASGLGERVQLIATTPEIQQWYGVADLLVCASRIESLPRAVLEGMAWELPVLATRIFGLPELIEEGATGWLCEPGDTAILSAALDRALSTGAEERRRLGRAGRELVVRRHAMDPYAAELADIFEQIASKERVSRRSGRDDEPASGPDSRRG